MKTITTTVFTFDELDEDAKETARDWFRQGIYDFDWYDSIYEDAKQVGLIITAFEPDRYCEANFAESAEETAHLIVDNHGDMCETYKTSDEYLKSRDIIINEAPRDDDGEFESVLRLDDDLDELDSEYLKSLCEDYRIMLRQEYEYMSSDECVDDNILANEYTFTGTGERFG